MKILMCHIENFGKLSDLTMHFSGGLCCICKENGWGKSTFAAFVRAMFYGLKGDRKRSVEENERKRYQPWQGGTFGGQLVFEAHGRTYQIARIFKDKEANDEFELRDAVTNLPSSDYSRHIGEELFQVDRASFLRTAFLGQNECETAPTDDIHAKIGNFLEGDGGGFDAASARLTELLNKWNPNRATGTLAKRKEEIAACARMVKNGEQITAQLREWQAQLCEAEESHLACKAQIHEARKNLQLCAELEKARERMELFRMTQTQEETYDALRRQFANGIPSDDIWENMVREASAFLRARETYRSAQMTQMEQARLRELEPYFAKGAQTVLEMGEKWNQRNIAKAALEQERERLAACDEAAAQREKKRAENSPLILLAGILLSLAGLALCGFASVPVGAIVASIGVILSVAGIAGISRSGRKRENQASDTRAGRARESGADGARMGKGREGRHRDALAYENLRQSVVRDEAILAQMDREVADYLASYGMTFSENAVPSTLQEILSESMEYDALKKKERSAKDAIMLDKLLQMRADLFSFLHRYGMEAEGENFLPALYLLKEKSEKYREYQERKSSFLQEKEEYEKLQKSVGQNFATLAEWNKKVQELSEEAEQARDRIAQCQKTLEELQMQADEWEAQSARLQSLKEIQAEEQKKYRYVSLAKEKLEMAKEALTAQYAAPIFQSFCRYYQMIAGEEPKGFHIDANAAITVDAYGRQRQANTLSRGYRDLIGICLRVAFVDAMYPDEQPPLLLDDPFSDLDDRKVGAGKQFLEQLAKNRQVIYFTCSASRT